MWQSPIIDETVEEEAAEQARDHAHGQEESWPRCWFRIAPVVLEAMDDKYLFFHPSFVGRLSPEDERETSAKPGAPYSVTIAIISDLADLDKQAKTDQARASVDRFRARYGSLNSCSLLPGHLAYLLTG
jgi:hypothetical protein